MVVFWCKVRLVLTSAEIFVYGTLMRGMAHEDLLAGRRDAKLLGPAVTRGALWDLGDHPGLTIGGKLSVAGELYRSDGMADILRRLDPFETEACFERRLIQVLCRRRTSRAWAYIYMGDITAARPIRGGSWKAHIKLLPAGGARA